VVQTSKVLVVDDEKSYLDDFLSLFSRKFEVVTAAGGREALALLEKEPVAVIVSDQRMPGMTGSEFLSEAARLYPRQVRILLTGYSDIDAVVEAVNKGEIYRYISKDTPLKEIELVVRQGLEKYNLEEANRQLLQAKKRLLKTLAVQENLSVVGTFGQQIHQRIETLVMNLFNYIFQMGKERDEKSVMDEFQRLQGALARLRELSSFSERLRDGTSGMEKTDLNHLVREAAEKAKKAAKDPVDLSMDLARVPEIPVHRYSFLRVMKELLENALLFGQKQGPKIAVRTRYEEATRGGEEESAIRIEVEDNGLGIPPDQLSKAFAPFYSTFPSVVPQGVPQPAPDEYNLGPHFHYGFGLPIAQWILCMRHQGMVELMSRPGKGTTAVITIPVASGQ